MPPPLLLQGLLVLVLLALVLVQQGERWRRVRRIGCMLWARACRGRVIFTRLPRPLCGCRLLPLWCPHRALQAMVQAAAREQAQGQEQQKVRAAEAWLSTPTAVLEPVLEPVLERLGQLPVQLHPLLLGNHPQRRRRRHWPLSVVRRWCCGRRHSKRACTPSAWPGKPPPLSQPIRAASLLPPAAAALVGAAVEVSHRLGRIRSPLPLPGSSPAPSPVTHLALSRC